MAVGLACDTQVGGGAGKRSHPPRALRWAERRRLHGNAAPVPFLPADPGSIVFWAHAVVSWRASGYVQPLLLFGYIGTALGVGLGLYALLPKKKKQMVGPVLFGRLWCGWACGTLMVLDLLPFRRSPGRRPSRWGWLRYGHFARLRPRPSRETTG